MHTSIFFIVASLSLCIASPIKKCHPKAYQAPFSDQHPETEEASTEVYVPPQPETYAYGPQQPVTEVASNINEPQYHGYGYDTSPPAPPAVTEVSPSTTTPCATSGQHPDEEVAPTTGAYEPPPPAVTTTTTIEVTASPTPTPDPETDTNDSGAGFSTLNENLVINPSFEEGVLCDVGESWCFVNGDDVPGWSSTSEIKLDMTGPAHDGKVSVELRRFLSQPIELVPGTDYELTFALSSNTCGNGKGYYTVYPQTGTSMEEINDHIFHFTGVKEREIVTKKFTATSSEYLLGFGSDSDSSCGPVIDNISLKKDQ
jgi:hypothetical protein